MKLEPNNQNLNRPRTAEELLRASTQTELTASEQVEMWGTLKSYAEFHPAKTSTAVLVPTKRAFLPVRLFSGVLAVLVLLVGTGVSSTYSLPGDFLYPVKVGVTEPAIGALQVSKIEKLEYEGKIINNRLGELKELSKIKQLREAEIAVIEEELVERTENIREILREETDLSIEARQSVRILSDILADVKTQEFIEDATFGDARQSKIELVEDSLSTLYLTEITDFIIESPDEVTEYIDEVLTDINTHVTEAASKEEVDLEVRDYLADVAEALTANDIEKAVYYVGEAEQVIEFNAEVEAWQEALEEIVQPEEVTE